MNNPPVTARSVLNPVTPLGVGTCEVESLISYFCRLALSHCITTGDLARKIACIEGWNLNPKWNSISVSLSGIGDSAEKWSRAISEMTAIECRNTLTLLPWSEVIAKPSLVSTSPRWCPTCFADDHARGKPPYTRLAWDIGVVVACARHRTKLIQACPDCGHTGTRHRSAYVVPGWCTKCGAFLGSTTDQRPATPEETWIASQVGDMLAWQATLNIIPSREVLLDCIRNLIVHLDGGNYTSFARRIGSSKSTVHYWAQKEVIPPLPTLLRIAFHTGLDLPKLLTGDLSDWSLACIENRIFTLSLLLRKNRASQVAYRNKFIQSYLKATKELPEPVSVLEVSRQLKTDSRRLYRIANEDTRAIGERWKQLCRERAEQHRNIARRAIEGVYFEILAEGKCVNLRELHRRLPNNILGRISNVFALLNDVKDEIEINRGKLPIPNTPPSPPPPLNTKPQSKSANQNNI
ncbi:TetR family transcriptional regulator [Burkholderia aenigmatica]|uniref:TetR family transcriptional regulator n=2 Tax=Burkholderiaceae TaxID=119060 RepID=A0A6J5JW03_9BURK|nr:TniQ family protein [Burkholderia aenigmatica]CAB3975265.1 TetR family transcriptional regulator [Burkholderia aenigmatica]